MGNTFGSASTRPPPEGVRQVNDSLYELYSPPDHTSPEVDIVFFHGLQIYDYTDAYFTTWSSNDGKQIWPQTLLSQRFPRARILSVCYDSCALTSATTGRMNLVRIGEALLGDVIESPNAGVGQARPVVLVGHCLGGLVIKRFLLDALKRASLYNSQFCDAEIEAINKFLNNVKGVFYYATPHGGFDVTEIARKLAWRSDLLDELSTFCKETESLNQDFNNLRHKYKISAYALYETHTTSFRGGQSSQLVAEASARRDMDQAYPARADHFTICKADSKTSMAFQKLEEFVQGKALNSIVSTSTFPFRKEQEPNKVFGMDHLVEEVKRMLVKERSLGLVGMGGLGKTTLARAVYNDLGPTYEYTCFILDVKIQKGDIESLIKERLHRSGKKISSDFDLNDLEEKLLLLVLDDVDCTKHVQIISILSNIGVHEGSRFILTSRDHALLKQDLDNVYEVPFLDIESSKTTLVNYAFRNKKVSPSFEDRIDNVVRICGNLPLALEVVGKHLYNKSEREWNYAISVLESSTARIGPNQKLWRQLKLSYDGLEDEVEKMMFIEAATMWNGEYLFEFKAAWSTRVEGEEHTRWQHLIDMSLVQIEESDSMDEWSRYESRYECAPIEDGGSLRIRVHEQLQSLAWSIAKDSNQIMSKLEELGEQPCEEIAWLKLSICDWGIWRRGVFPQLRFMHLSNIYTHDDIESFPRNLVTLQLYCVPSLPIKDLPNLRVLKLKNIGNLSHFSPGKSSELRVLEVYWCRNCSIFPDMFEQVAQLRSLTLVKVDLKILPDAFGRLSKLMLLTVISCPLHSLPTTFGHLHQLRCVNLASCSELRRLPESFGSLSALIKLGIRNCPALEELPESFGNLSALTQLGLWDCGAMKKLPDAFGNLSALTWLHMSSCRALEELPDSFGNLSVLHELDMSGCRALEELPDSFGNLSALHELDLSGCGALKVLPDSFGNLSALTELNMRRCRALKELPDSFGNLSALTMLMVDNCRALKKLPDSFGNLSALMELYMWGCGALKVLPESFGNLSALTKVEMSGCGALKKLPDSFGDLSALTDLDMRDCGAMEVLPESFGNL